MRTGRFVVHHVFLNCGLRITFRVCPEPLPETRLRLDLRTFGPQDGDLSILGLLRRAGCAETLKILDICAPLVSRTVISASLVF